MQLRRNSTAVLVAGLTAWLACAMPALAPAATSPRSVIDMAGRTVPLPDSVERVVAVGSVPVIHSFILTMGKAETIVNGLPLFAQGKRYHFHRLFRTTVGETVKHYSQRLRLEQAAFRLKLHDTPIIDVAVSLGYHSHETFTRAYPAPNGKVETDLFAGVE